MAGLIPAEKPRGQAPRLANTAFSHATLLLMPKQCLPVENAPRRLPLAEHLDPRALEGHLGGRWMGVEETGGRIQTIRPGVGKGEDIADGERGKGACLRQHVRWQA